MDSSPSERQVEQFVYKLLITGAWLDEVVQGLGAELPVERHPGEDPTAVVLQMLCGTISSGLQSVDQRDVRRATELIDLAASRTEDHIRLVSAPSSRKGDGADGKCLD